MSIKSFHIKNCGKTCRKAGILLHLNSSCPSNTKKNKNIHKPSTQPVLAVGKLRPRYLCAFSSRSVPKFKSKDLHDRHVAIYHQETLYTPLFQNQEINMDKHRFKNACEDFPEKDLENLFDLNKCPCCLSKVLNTVGYRKECDL